MASQDHLIEKLTDERNACVARIAALDGAIEALTGSRSADWVAFRPKGATSVGPDKLDSIRRYIRSKGEVRQAELGKALSLNSGTVSTACRKLLDDGEIEELPKRDRSRVLRVKK